MPQRFHVTPAQGIAQVAALLALLLWLIKLCCRTWATRLFCLGVLIATVASPFSLAGKMGVAPFGALATGVGLILAQWGIAKNTRRETPIGREEQSDTVAPEVSLPRRTWRHFLLSPGLLMSGLLLTVCFLWHAEHIGKGWPVLISLAAVGAAATLVSIWWGTARFFRRRFQLTRRAWPIAYRRRRDFVRLVCRGDCGGPSSSGAL